MQRSTAHGRVFAPLAVGVIGVLVVLALVVAIDLHQTRMIRVTARNGVVFEIAEMAGKGDMLGTGDVLVAKEQDLVRAAGF